MSEQPVFRQDNTQGYTDSELARINEQWEVTGYDIDTDAGQTAAEKMLLKFDQES